MVALAEATRESPAANRVLSRLAASHATGRRRLTGLARKLQKTQVDGVQGSQSP